MTLQTSPISRITRFLELAAVALRPEDRNAKLRARTAELRARTRELIEQRRQRTNHKQVPA
jgi:hypothetical protein